MKLILNFPWPIRLHILTVFDPLLLPWPDSVAFLEYGKGKIQEIAKIYAPQKVPEVVAELKLLSFT